MAIIQCPECGKEISDTAVRCIYCGYTLKTNKTKDAISDKYKAIKQWGIANKKRILAVLLILVVVIAVWRVFLPNLFASSKKLHLEGNYQQLYDKASDEQSMKDIYLESYVAKACAETMTLLKDSSSFKLRSAMRCQNFFLEVEGNNSYGAKVINYFVFRENDNNDLEYVCSFSDFNEEPTYSWQDSEETAKIRVINAEKQLMLAAIDAGKMWYLPDEGVKCINEMAKSGKLKDVEPVTTMEPTDTAK